MPSSSSTSYVKQTLIDLGILHNRCGFTFHRKHHRALTSFELPYGSCQTGGENIVSDWMSLVISITVSAPRYAPF
jgi:hypothetical protein